jgi:hypothetical protein
MCFYIFFTAPRSVHAALREDQCPSRRTTNPPALPRIAVVSHSSWQHPQYLAPPPQDDTKQSSLDTTFIIPTADQRSEHDRRPSAIITQSRTNTIIRPTTDHRQTDHRPSAIRTHSIANTIKIPTADHRRSEQSRTNVHKTDGRPSAIESATNTITRPTADHRRSEHIQ